MPQSLFRSFSADADQRSVSLTRSDGFPGAFSLSSASIWEGCHQHVRRDSRMAKQEWSALKRALMFTFQMAIGAVACAGAILAIFAWTGASLLRKHSKICWTSWKRPEHPANAPGNPSRDQVGAQGYGRDGATTGSKEDH
jgi:hypothetical protein